MVDSAKKPLWGRNINNRKLFTKISIRKNKIKKKFNQKSNNYLDVKKVYKNKLLPKTRPIFGRKSAFDGKESKIAK